MNLKPNAFLRLKRLSLDWSDNEGNDFYRIDSLSLTMQAESTKILLDIQSPPSGSYEVTSSNLEGFNATSTTILEAIEQAISASKEESEIN